MKTLVVHSVFFALIGLMLSPLAVAHASSSPDDSVHFCAPFDYEQWRRDHPRPAGKRLAALNVGEPRTVRMIYFLPNDRPYSQEVVDSMKVMIRRVQTFYAEQMQAHGYGNTTFRFETDTAGEPLVHRVDGQHPDRHYNNNDTTDEVLDEIWYGEGPLQFDVLANDYLIVIDNSTGTIETDGSKAGGVNRDLGKRGGITLVPSSLYFGTVAHELGHTFGLWHDFRDDAYIMSYGYQDRLSACAAEFLSVHPYFNSDISLGGETSLSKDNFSRRDTSKPSTFKMISSPEYPAGSTSVSVRLKVSDAEGLHQVFLMDRTRESDGGPAGYLGLAACRGLDGEKDAVVEFEYDVSIPPFRQDPSDPEAHSLWVYVVDADGEVTSHSYEIAEASPYHIATLDHQEYIRSVSFSPDGTLLATSEQLIPTVRLWDVASRQQVATLALGDWSTSLSFSPDGTLLAVGEAGRRVTLWDVANRRQIDTLYPSGWDFKSLSFLPDGTLLAVGGSGGEVTLWDVASRQQVATLQSGSVVYSVSFSPDGTLLATAEGEENLYTVRLWDVASRQQVATLQPGGREGYVESVSFSPDGTLLATAGDLKQLWDVASRQEVATLQPESQGTSLSFSPDGTLLAIGVFGKVRLWDVASRQLVTVFAHSGFVRPVSFSPDGTLLVTAGIDQRVRLWDVSEWAGSSEQAMPQTLTKVSGEGQGGQAGEPLAAPFVVSVLDQNGSAFAGVVVTFSVTAGGGTLSSTTVTTDANGRARSTLTLGSEPGANTVAATVAGLETVTFTATASGQTSDSQDPEPDPQWESLSATIDDVTSTAEHGRMTFTVRLEPTPTAPTTVKYATASQTARAGEDYEAATGTLHFGANQNIATFTVRIRPDQQDEPNETFAVRIEHPSTHALLAEATGTITDDDGATPPEADSDGDDEPAFGFAGAVEDQAYTAGAAIPDLVLPVATGGEGEITYRVSGLSAGLSFDAVTRTISGTPEADGAVEVTYTAQDSTGAAVTLTFSITVNPPLSFGDLFN